MNCQSIYKYFTEIGARLSSQIENVTPDFFSLVDTCGLSISVYWVDLNVFNNQLTKIKTSKFSGLDKIPVKLLKNSAAVVAPFLKSIFNKSFLIRIFRSVWKTTRVSPIYKSGERDECGNYRPCNICIVHHLKKYLKNLSLNKLIITLQKIAYYNPLPVRI